MLPNWTVEDELIAALFDLEDNYSNRQPLTSYCFPSFDPSYYNSNPFAAGLLNAAGVRLPSGPDQTPAWFYPGWSKPVPTSQFQPPVP